uniref:Uncharacterized protein n=1 Tax=Rhizophagus irregularis (strain DAOM 181602 / DAOM 197198 / MUCL 43194) TaxID=747089 RepID=U9SII6_RHIID
MVYRIFAGDHDGVQDTSNEQVRSRKLQEKRIYKCETISLEKLIVKLIVLNLLPKLFLKNLQL